MINKRLQINLLLKSISKLKLGLIILLTLKLWIGRVKAKPGHGR